MSRYVSYDDPDAVDVVLGLIITAKEDEARERRDKALADLLRPENETQPD